MKFIVTGGCGFIGTHLVRELLRLGHNVIVIDDLSSGSYCKKNVIKGVEYSFGSVCDDDITWLFEGVDCVFHLAAQARIQSSIDDPQHTFESNICGIMNILEACRKYSVPRLVNSSSSSIYGLTDQFPTKETNPPDCLNPYATSKLVSEQLIDCYAKVYGLKAFNLRYFNVFGEDSPVTGPYSLVVGLFLHQCKNGQELTIVGDGSSRRDYVYVGDVVDANIRAMLAAGTRTEAFSEVINIGSGQNISAIEIARKISPHITYVSSRPGEAKETLADITRAKQILDWEPRTLLTDWLTSAT